MKNKNSIVEQLRAGDEMAYKYIYDHHYVLLWYVANEYVKDRFLAETIVGDVIFHLWEIRKTLDVTVSIRSYLMRSVRNRCLDYLKSEQVKREIPFSIFPSDYLSAAEGYFLSDDYPLGSLLERELEDEINKAVESLPSECKRVFLKSRFEGKKHEEIANELNISVSTVKYHLKNALISLSEALEKYLIILFLLLL